MFMERKLLSLLFLPFVWRTKAQTISDSLNGFALDLLTATSAAPQSPKNLAMSPYTVWTLLSALDEGAREETAKQLEKVLSIPGASNKAAFRAHVKNLSDILLSKDPDVNLDLFNSIFTPIDLKLNINFRNISRKNYGVNVQPIDFKNTTVASAQINNYVALATKNRITKFIRPDDLIFAQVFLVSVLYFKGTWTSPFNRTLTRKDTFYDEQGMKLGEVDMMYQMGVFAYSRLDWIKGLSVEIPYGSGDKMSMILILPYKDQTIQGMLQLMKQDPFSRIMDKLDKAKEFEGDVTVYLPRFRIVSDLALNIVLDRMGITDVFDANRANLLGVVPHYLRVSHLIQRAEIEVDEEGTVTGSASGAAVYNKIAPPKFVANKPFLYFMVNKPAKSIVFEGKVTAPPK